jgi:integrase
LNLAAYGGSPWPLFPSQLPALLLVVHGQGRQARRAEGAPLNWRLVTFVPARTRAGLSGRFRIHDLRRTAASLIQAGYPPKMLQEIMGHARITTTLDLYWNSRELHQTGEKSQVA